MSTLTATTTATQAAKALLPMEPAKLIARAEEMYTTFNPARVTVDAHADERILKWKVRNEDDATFLRQVFYGCIRYKRLIGIFISAFMHHNAGTVLLGDADMYVVYAYLALLRLEELGFPQFKRLINAQEPQKMIVFLGYLFNEHNLVEYMKALVARQEEKVYMAIKAEEEEANSCGAKSKAKTTVPEPFNLSESKPTPLPAPELLPEPLKPKPVPPKREGPTPEESAIAEAREENRRRVANQYADPNLVFRLRSDERPMNIDKVRAEVESELARVATFAPPPCKPAPKFAPQPKREVKLNAAAILREDALYKKKQLEEAKMMERFETELRDDSEFSRWQSQMRAEDDEARRLKVEQTKREMEEAFKAALRARVEQVGANAKLVEQMRLEAKDGEARRAEELSALDEENRRRREKVIADKAGVERAQEKLAEERKAAAERRNQEKTEAALRLAEERAAEQQRKAELVRQLRALEAVPRTAVPDAKGEQSTTAGLGLLEDMSLAELKERLAVAKRRAKEDEEARRELILKAKREKEALLREKMVNINRVRSLAGAQATQRRSETAEEAAAAAAALRAKNEREAGFFSYSFWSGKKYKNIKQVRTRLT